LSPETITNKGALHIHYTYIHNNLIQANNYKTYCCKTQGVCLHARPKLPFTLSMEDQASSLNQNVIGEIILGEKGSWGQGTATQRVWTTLSSDFQIKISIFLELETHRKIQP